MFVCAMPCTSNSAACAAGQPVLAVMFSRTKRALVARLMATVLPEAGSKRYPADPTTSAKFVPLVLPWTDSVCVRASQPDGSLSTSWVTLAVLPRSAWIHCGNTLFVLSQ